MNEIYFTPGPSQLYPTVKKHINVALKQNIATLSHRSSKFSQIYQNIDTSLKKLLKIPANYQIFFLGSASECMERIILNCVIKTSFHFVSGAFSKRWLEIAQELKKETLFAQAETNQAFDFDSTKIPNSAEIICITQNETSTGTKVPESQIHELKNKYPQKLMAVDLVSSIPNINLDFKLIDLGFFSVQKGFGLPAGLGVLIISPKAMEKFETIAKKGGLVGGFHTFSSLSKYAAKFQTPETPNVLYIYLFSKVLEDMLKIGIEKIKEETSTKAKLLYQFFDKHPQFKPFIQNKTIRSDTVLTIETENSQEMVAKLAKNGYILDSGYGPFKGKQVRIANFPAINISSVRELIKQLSSIAEDEIHRLHI